MLTLFGALNMMTDLEDPDWINRIAHLTLYTYHNEVNPPVNHGIYKFEFQVEPMEVEVWSENNPYGHSFGQFRPDVYFYRPSVGYDEKSDPQIQTLPEPTPVLLSVERCTRAELETDPTIPKIEVVIPAPDESWLDRTDWWTELWVEELAREFAPKWICEHYVTGRFKNMIKVTYIPVLIKSDQLGALSKARGLIEDLVEAINCTYKGLKRNLF